MNETMSETGSKVADVVGCVVLQWGENEEDVRYVASVVERIEQAGSRASMATDYTRDRAEFIADLRGAATLMGLVVSTDKDVVEALRSFLLASRDHEGETSEAIIRAANGKSEDERRAARRARQRGLLDAPGPRRPLPAPGVGGAHAVEGRGWGANGRGGSRKTRPRASRRWRYPPWT